MPNLIVIAGCNGAGKSTFAKSFLPDSIESFDFDKRYLEIYSQLPDSELREEFAHNKTASEFEKAILKALENNLDFCYETNFDQLPIVWAEKFKNKGFTLSLIFFCLDNQEIAKHRVRVRTEFRGHFVNDKTIDVKWKAGYKNINLHYTFFDNILLVDNSQKNAVYSNILQIQSRQIELMTECLPEYFERRFPDIYKDINE